MSEQPPDPSLSVTSLSARALESHRQGDLESAEKHYRDALVIEPDNPDLLHRLGLLLLQAGRPREAVPLLQESLDADASAAQTWLLLGMAQAALSNHDDALRSCHHSLALQAANPRALNLAANLEQQLGNAVRARELLEQALSLNPDFADAHHNMGITLASLGENDAALSHYNKAVQLTPRVTQLHCNRGLLLLQTGQTAAAKEAFESALSLNQGHLPSRLECIYSKLLLCDWQGLDDDLGKLHEDLDKMLATPGTGAVSPYILNLCPASADRVRKVSERYASEVSARAGQMIHVDRPAARQDGRIRIAYLSPDLGAHAVGGLVYKLFAHHDREHFTVCAFSLRQFDDVFARTIRAGCDEFHDLSDQSLQLAAKTIIDTQPDMLIDLGGYTAGTRPELMAARLAPVQLSWLGYLNTSGSSFIDYIVADRQVIPKGEESRFSEAIARMPGTFLPASQLPVADVGPTRAQLGLPEDATVFCSFNNTYKIQEDTFSAWMQILHRVEGSVLWIYAGSRDQARENLLRAASARGIGPERLVFARGLAMDEHMARLPRADLFLDTFHYNAGATAVGALSAGVPLLTLRGGRMLGRMGASLNNAAGLTGLICESPGEYVEKAVKLASHPQQLRELRDALNAVIDADKVFSISQFAARFDHMLKKIWAHHEAGKQPATFGT